MSSGDYLGLLRWTAQRPEVRNLEHVLPATLQPLLSRLRIDLSMWRNLVWDFQKYFGKSCCAGNPLEMNAFAGKTGRRWARGHRGVAKCFA